MTNQSALLRARHTRDGGGRSILNKDARRQEKHLDSAVVRILAVLRTEFPDLAIQHTKKMMLGDHRSNIESKKSYFSPDGGFIFVDDAQSGRRVYVLISEAKKQGTNALRATEGMKKQAKGNAIERAHKNFTEAALLLEDQKTFPYLVCCSGCDFDEGSTIYDRASGMCAKSPFNTLYWDRDERQRPRASLMIRPEAWTEDEIVEFGLKIAREVISAEFPQ